MDPLWWTKWVTKCRAHFIFAWIKTLNFLHTRIHSVVRLPNSTWESKLFWHPSAHLCDPGNWWLKFDSHISPFRNSNIQNKIEVVLILTTVSEKLQILKQGEIFRQIRISFQLLVQMDDSLLQIYLTTSSGSNLKSIPQNNSFSQINTAKKHGLCAIFALYIGDMHTSPGPSIPCHKENLACHETFYLKKKWQLNYVQ